MQGTTHVAIGFLSGAAVAAGFHVPLYLQTGAVLMVASIGSLMPDIDTPASKMSKSLGGLRKPIGLFAHRGLTHSLFAVIVIAILMVFLQVQFIHAVVFWMASFGVSETELVPQLPVPDSQFRSANRLRRPS